MNYQNNNCAQTNNFLIIKCTSMKLSMLQSVLLSILITTHLTQATNHVLGTALDYMPWVTYNGSLVVPEFRSHISPGCSGSWTNIMGCSFCTTDQIFNCTGKGLNKLPLPQTIHTLFNNTQIIKLFIVSETSLNALPPESFIDLNITDLIFDSNSLSYLSDEAFEGMKHLKTLTIKQNTITTLSNMDTLFSNLPSLEALYLEGNQLRIITGTTSDTSCLKNLKYLSLADNPLSVVSLKFLKDSKLQYLNLRNVTFDDKNAERMCASSLPDTLTTVDLSDSNITDRVLDRLFSSLRDHRITTLSLANIRLDQFPLAMLKHLRNSLKRLSLTQNQIQILYAEEHDLKNGVMTELTELDMRKCSILSVSQNIFTALPNLKLLSLSGNRIYYFDTSQLLSLTKLEYLDLSYNYNIYSFVVPTPLNKSGNYSLKLLDLSETLIGNLVEYFAGIPSFIDNVEILSLHSSKVTAKSVSGLGKMTKLEALDISNVLSRENTAFIVNSFKDAFKNLSSLESLYFVDNQFDFNHNEETKDMFSSLKSLKLLNLTDNAISTISDINISNLDDLEMLILDNNYIDSWNVSVLTNHKKLKLLDLSHNHITVTSQGMYNDFLNTNTLNLQGNPLICGDHVTELLCSQSRSATQNNSNNDVQTNIVQSDKLTCLNAETKQIEPVLCMYRPEHSSQTSNKLPQAVYYSAVGIVIVIVFLLTTVGAVHWKWWYIKYYVMFTKGTQKLRLLKKQQLNEKQNFTYDVFISYSDTDRAWVLDELITNLEGTADIRVCFHERDFLVGVSILENIIQSMDRSRSLLMVISNSFVKSRWCQFEMHLAQYCLVECKRDHIILVLLEDIPRDIRPKTLQHLMATKTYLLWPNQKKTDAATELFWKRLRRAIRIDQNCYSFA